MFVNHTRRPSRLFQFVYDNMTLMPKYNNIFVTNRKKKGKFTFIHSIVSKSNLTRGVRTIKIKLSLAVSFVPSKRNDYRLA